MQLLSGVNPYSLGTQLDVDHQRLKDIESNYQESERRIKEVLISWCKKDTSPDLKTTLIKALKHIKENTIAKELEEDPEYRSVFCKKRKTDPSQQESPIMEQLVLQQHTEEMVLVKQKIKAIEDVVTKNTNGMEEMFKSLQDKMTVLDTKLKKLTEDNKKLEKIVVLSPDPSNPQCTWIARFCKQYSLRDYKWECPPFILHPTTYTMSITVLETSEGEEQSVVVIKRLPDQMDENKGSTHYWHLPLKVKIEFVDGKDTPPSVDGVFSKEIDNLALRSGDTHKAFVSNLSRCSSFIILKVSVSLRESIQFQSLARSS